MSTVSNVGTIARREYVVRVRSRSFVIATIVLVIAVLAISFAPALISRLATGDPTRIEVTSAEPGLAQSIAGSVGPLLNGAASTDSGSGSAAGAGVPRGDFVVTVGSDTAAARAGVVADKLDAVLEATRDAGGSLAFTLYTAESSTGRVATMVRQAATAAAIADRLDRLGIAEGEQAALFAPADLEVAWPDPNQPGPTKDDKALIGESMLGFGMTILIFTMIIIYGTWIAQSVVEEKQSRVMEVVLNAATPFQLLAGKVFGVGAVALTQYSAVLLAGALSVVLQGPVLDLILGRAGTAAGVGQGLTPALLIAFAAYGALGFMMYATLFAAAGSLVSRSEDVNSAVMPLTVLCTAGYLVGTYGATGLFDNGAAWMVGLALVPFLSPFMMLGRIASGAVEPWQVAASLGLLALGVLVALWIAARVYAVGVLTYGSWPGWKGAWRLLRSGM